MRLVLVACAMVALVSSPASACRGLWEYPQAMTRLAQLDITVDQRNDYKKALDAGWDMHQLSQQRMDPDLMKESVRMLDEIKAKLGL